MRRIFLSLCIIISSTLLNAEDIIITRTSEKISAIIEEVGADYIKYHKASNPQGPIYRLEANEIATILYSNGDIQTFEENQAETDLETNPSQFSPQGPYPYYPQSSYGAVGPFVDYKALERQRKDSIKAAKKVAFKAKLNAIPREHFVLANYSYAFNNTHNIGVTYGWCHAVGFYANFMLGLNGFHYSPEGKIEFRGDYGNSGYLGSQLTNEHTHQRISVTPGILVRLGCPLYFNFGCGFAYHTVTHKATNGDWVDCQWLGSGQAAINFQIGLLGNFKGFSLMANYSSFGFRHSEILIGIGFALEGKKGGKNEN